MSVSISQNEENLRGKPPKTIGGMVSNEELQNKNSNFDYLLICVCVCVRK